MDLGPARKFYAHSLPGRPLSDSVELLGCEYVRRL